MFRKQILVITACALTLAAHAELTWVGIKPSETDPRISTFNTPHWICVNEAVLLGKSEAGIKDRHELLLFLPGTSGHGRGPKEFLETAANLGYHVITLMYPDDVPAASFRNDRNKDAFEAFRMAIIRGGRTPYITVDLTDSIENRLAKLLLCLESERPRENWGQFLQGEGIAWEHIAMAGQSQGGGHAALIAIKHRVARVLMFGAPKDYSIAYDEPAAWYAEIPATPLRRFFAINHMQDRQGCDFRQQLKNLAALKMDRFGAPVDVDNEGPPYRHSRILITNYPGTPVDSKTAHGTAIGNRHKAVFLPVWNYLLTEPTGAEK
jgi:hypothetical protein